MTKKLLVIIILMLTVTGCSTKFLSTEETKLENPVVNNTMNEEQTSTEQIETTSEAPVEVKKATSSENNIQENNMTNPKEVKQVLMKTNKGDIKIALDWENAPISAENFLKYVESGFYNGTLFHRVIPSFMIQGGGFDEKGSEKATLEPIKNEAKNGLRNDRGTLAMARTMVVDSATSQFFINLVDNDFLNYRDERNYGYAVFGKVVEGMDTVDAIAGVKTGDNGMHQNWPLENVVIENVSFIK